MCTFFCNGLIRLVYPHRPRVRKRVVGWRKPRIYIGFVLLTALLLVSCTATQGPAPPSNEGMPAVFSLKATPNPVPAGTGVGSTTITWSTADNSLAQVYVSQNGEAETLFAEGPGGSKVAPWISSGATYEFRLYEGKEHKKMLASVKVTRSEK